MSRNRTALSEDFSTGGLEVGRYKSPLAGAALLDSQEFAAQIFAQAERQEFTAVGQISQAWLADRCVDFRGEGPLLGISRERRLVVSTPAYALPTQSVWHDAKDRPVWDLESLSPQKREQVTKFGRLKPVRLKIESFASGRNGHFYVLQPLTQILFRTVDADRNLKYVNFLPDPQGRHPVMLYDPKTGQLVIYGGGQYLFA